VNIDARRTMLATQLFTWHVFMATEIAMAHRQEGRYCKGNDGLQLYTWHVYGYTEIAMALINKGGRY
jgi:hypothetical protein